MKVSVIIPAFNVASYLAKAIQSVLQQEEVEECLVVDDGSTDGSRSIIEQYCVQDQRVKLLFHSGKINKGTSASRNLGLQSAKYEFIAFLDADDYWLENRFKETKDVFANNPNADAVYEAIADEGWNGHSESGSITMMRPQHDVDKAFLDMEPFGKSGHFSVIGLTIKKEILRRVGFFSEPLRLTQDTEWMARLALTASLYPGQQNNLVARRRLHGGNSSKNITLLRQSRVEMCFTLLQWMEDKNLTFSYKESVINVLLKYHYENNCLNDGNWFRRKKGDLIFLSRLKGLEPKAMELPRVKYFRRLVLLLPIKKHLNFYE